MISFLKYKLAFLYPLVVQYRLFRQRNNPRQIFTAIYKRNAWGCAESVSGWNSTVAGTANLRVQLPELMQQYGLRHICDIPCGDFNWMKEVPMAHFTYFGGDVVPEIIAENKLNWEAANRQFEVVDLLKDKLPPSDLFLCRGCFDHFSETDVKRAVRNIKKSRSVYLLVTTYTSAVNKNILTGDFRAINLQAPPYNFPAPLALLPDDEDAVAGRPAEKFLGLWKVSELPTY